jgi:hypothetical protein
MKNRGGLLAAEFTLAVLWNLGSRMPHHVGVEPTITIGGPRPLPGAVLSGAWSHFNRQFSYVNRESFPDGKGW